VETELKLLLAPQDLRLLRRDPGIRALQQGRASTRLVRSVYYDTPEFALLRAGLALRLRSEGKRWLQTLKTEGRAAAGLHLREEWEWPLPGEALDFGLLATTPEAKRFRAPRLRAALTVNRHRDIRPSRELIRQGVAIESAKLRDEDIELKSLVPVA